MDTGPIYRFAPSHFHKITRWSQSAQEAIAALCPTGRLERDYYLHPLERN